ncbi:hypothetical protein C5749_18695 [Sphingobacterium gobiense]|uniref:Uncharacterized protein n=1 Tax=Sphingobacterium gobiense TaxID=1382456 RepID=A0A2S9JET8_9SPHI|nr:hypothetical protein C5749_18695 [Sphingobacterium gobiense]
MSAFAIFVIPFREHFTIFATICNKTILMLKKHRDKQKELKDIRREMGSDLSPDPEQLAPEKRLSV